MSPALFRPSTLRSLVLPNRIVVSPMCQYSADHGHATDWHLMHLGMLSQSGAGQTMIEATAVSEVGRITPGCLGLWSDTHEAALARVLAAIRLHSPNPIGIQLGHAGRKGSSAAPWHGGQLIAAADGGWTPVAPSALPHRADEAPPAQMSAADIDTLVQDFAQATRRADRLVPAGLREDRAIDRQCHTPAGQFELCQQFADAE